MTDPAKRLRTAERTQRAVELRTAGHTWQAIADALGYSSRMAAHKAVTRALDRQLTDLAESAAQHRAMALLRLDRLYQAVAAQLDSDSPLPAIDRAVRIEERRARLLGLDAPDRADFTVRAPVTFIDGVRLDNDDRSTTQ